jgi:hypothetical protein
MFFSQLVHGCALVLRIQDEGTVFGQLREIAGVPGGGEGSRLAGVPVGLYDESRRWNRLAATAFARGLISHPSFYGTSDRKI